MSAEFSGTITNVTEEPVGSTLDEDVSSGASALKPADPEQFNPDGGTLLIGSEQHGYTLSGDTLNLDGTLAESYEEGEPILIYPPAVERWAFVREPGGEEGLQVRVPHALWDRIPLGIRAEGEGEEVECELTIDGVAVITDVIAKEPAVDGTYLQDHTVRPEVITDGEPPSESPTPEVSGGIGSLVVKWDAISNHDPVTYEVHVSDSQGFTPGPSTLAAEVQGTLIFIRTLPAGGALQGGTTYYVRLIARDHDGAAAPSDEASGEIVVLNTADIPSDGEVPPQVDTPSVTPGPGFLFAEWEPAQNADPVAYEVHVGNNPLFTPGPASLYATTPATSIVISKEPDGSELDLEQPYYVSIIATDPDGPAQASGLTEGHRPAAQITETLIEDNAISTPKLQANSVIAGKIAANAVTANEIATNAVTADKILASAVTADKIAAEAVTADKLLANEALFELLQTVLLVSNTIKVPGETGQRLEQDIDGLRLYNSDDEVTANLSTQSGSAYLRGRVDFGQGSALLPGDTLELKDQPLTDYETPVLVQSRRSVGSGTSGIVTLDTDAQAGAVRILYVRSFSNVTHTLATAFDEQASYWELVASVATSDAGRLSVWVRTEEDDQAPPFTPTINFGSSTDWVAGCFEYVGVELGEAHDVAATTSGGSSSSITIGPTATTTQDGTLALALVAWNGQDHIIGSGWQQVGPGGFNTVAAYRVLDAQEALSYSGTFEDDASGYLGILAAFKLRPAGGTPSQPPSGRIRLYSDGQRPHYIDSNGDPYELATTDLVPGKMVAGTVTVSTGGSSSQSSVVAHGLGATPSQVLCTARDGAAVLRVSSRDSTHFTLDVLHRDQGSTFSVDVPVDWLAIA